MIKKTITYTDYDGLQRTEEFRFHLTEAEMFELEIATPGGYTNLIKKIMDTKDTAGMVKLYKELILKTYGEKSPDGKRFMKSPEISKAFEETPAYNELFMELVQDAKKFADFITGVMPDNLRQEVLKSQEYADVQKQIAEQEKLIKVEN